ncbi:MAG: SAF domain-containing protein [Erysipelotrichaceae bacterium]|nr:SAF domain-containing protein [Erysipelotrichaceae bacterium]
MKKLWIKWLLIFLVTLLLVGADILLLQLISSQQLKMTNVYVATHDILPRTCIKEEDIGVIKIPLNYVDDKAFVTKEDILGKYTDIQGKIPKGSLFYKTMLFKQEDLADYPTTKLHDGQMAYSLNVNVNELAGNTISEDQRIDLYVTLNLANNTCIVDKLIANARVLSIRDNKGFNITHPKSTKVPSVIIFAVDEKSVKYLAKAEKMGTIKLLASSESYSNQEATLNQESQLLTYLDELPE